jgi:SAM-dependent methyltransferase
VGHAPEVKSSMRPDLITDLFEKEGSYWWNVSKRQMVFSMLNANSKQNQAVTRVGIDIGCGAGYTTKVFASEWQMVGADVSRNALQLCKNRGLERLCQVDMTDFSLPFKTGSFDLVLALDVVEHLEDDIRALIECRRILKLGGLLIVTVPAFMALWSPWDESLGHKRRYTLGQLAVALQKAGLSVKKSSYIYFFVFPIAVLIRSVKRLIEKDPRSYSSDFIRIPKILNNLLLQVGRLEQWAIARLNLRFPFGLSVISVAVKE